MNLELHPEVPFSIDERIELEAVLATHDLMDLSTLHGFMTAVLSGPTIPLDEWLDTIWKDGHPQFASEKDFERIVQLIGRFFNATATSLVQIPMDFKPVLYIAQKGEEPAAVAQGWCTGYLLGVTLRERPWQRLLSRDSVAQFVNPIMVLYKPEDPDFAEFHDPKSQQDFVDMLGEAASGLFIAWQLNKESASKHTAAKKRKRA